MKAGDVVDVAGYEYTIWNQAEWKGEWFATREQSPTVTVCVSIYKSGGRWKVRRQWLTSHTPDSRPPVDSNHIPMRRSPSDTQQAMVAKYLPRAGTKRALIYDLIIEHDGLTDDEIEVITGFLHQSASATRNSLMNDGWIKDSGERRKNRNGNMAIVWVNDDSPLTEGTPKSEHHDSPMDSPARPDPDPAPTTSTHGPGYCGRKDCLICESDPWAEDYSGDPLDLTDDLVIDGIDNYGSLG